ncbi:ferritin [Corynebacterium sp. 153RC1]|uniref:ferritin n=1 Tax=Corynebacterium TaxID=1716 RepID=UPI00211BFCB1|nr:MULTISPECIES: ferritin [unclassified Corynebacterium]MCQ9370883.1 ferritin [Corynebacterium sp. 35RC1]MCQ9343293.1 ferritin [Corynebacterium sp. 76QC2CO]MCQ9353212.1 ferritin [Corynebacterium sp. 209RC1]MCQ9355493.1 ferritin [Corynebacterium sp. 1222RC1]MCQ9357710.1 ferritin [Corynebacterium sp. 122RC1]
MAINEKLAAAMNNQVTAELEAAMVYLQLSYHMDDLGLVGMRDWFQNQHQEELTHAEAFAEHLRDRGYVPQIGDITPPKLDIANATDAFEASLAHEQKVSGLIRDLAALSDSVKDYDSRPLLDHFLAEQIEEEATVGGILDRLKLADTGAGILQIDKELAERDSAE